MVKNDVHNISQIIDINRASSLDKLVCITSYLIKFINMLKRKEKKQTPVTAKETMWIKAIQLVIYTNTKFKL